ncbi:ATP-dependent helicase [bacterium]
METTKNKIFTLTNEQSASVNTLDGIVCLSAGPGCGKTFVLVKRYLNIIQKLVNDGIELEDAARSILAVTFTNKAAHEMRERIQNELTKQSIDNIEKIMQAAKIATIDAWALNILKDNAFEIGIDNSFKIIDTTMCRIGFLNIAKSYFDKTSFEDLNIDMNIDIFLHEIFKFVSVLKCRLIDSWYFLYLSNKHEKEKQIAEMIFDLYLAYEKWLEQNNYMDFSNLLFYVYQVFKSNHKLVDKYASEIKFMLIDEYQDINDAQDFVLRTLSGKIKSRQENYFIVGDIGQSIYGFRNADYKNMLEYKERISDKNLNLSYNFRSSKNIINFINEYFLIKASYFQKLHFLDDTAEGDKVELMISSSLAQEAASLAQSVKNLLDDGCKPSDIKILLRSIVQNVWVYAEAFAKYQIPFIVIGAAGFDRRIEVRDFLYFLKLINDPFDDIAILRVIKSPVFGLTNTDLIYLRRKFQKNKGENIYETMRNALQEDISKQIKFTLNKLVNFIEKYIALANTMRINELFEDILEYTNYNLYIQSLDEVDYYRCIDSVEKFKKVIRAYESEQIFATLDDFLAYFDELSQDGFSMLSDVDVSNLDEVAFMTIHQSKGLEFPVVFTAGISLSGFPGRNKQPKLHFHKYKGLIVKQEKEKDSDYIKYLKPVLDEEHQKEEFRILYVALTRAKEKLFISGYENKKGKVSTFLNDLVEKDEEKYEIKNEFKNLINLNSEKQKKKVSNNSLEIKNNIENIKLELSEKLYDQNLIPQNLKQKYFYSVTSLEVFRQCPKKYYLKYILQIPEPSNFITTKFDYAAFGTCVHKFLELYYSNAAGEEEFKSLVGNMGLMWDKNIGNKYKKLIAQISNEKNEGKPEYFEKNFVWKVGGHFVRGTIDRIDKLESGEYNIVDYKTGSKPKQEVYDLSMNIYAKAFEELQEVQIKDMILYYPFIDGRNKFNLIRDDGIKSNITAILENIENCNFQNCNFQNCTDCSFKKVCDKSFN